MTPKSVVGSVEKVAAEEALVEAALVPLQPTAARVEYLRVLPREVKLGLTPETEAFHMLLERCRTKNRKSSIKQHIKSFNFQSRVLLDHPAGC